METEAKAVCGKGCTCKGDGNCDKWCSSHCEREECVKNKECFGGCELEAGHGGISHLCWHGHEFKSL